MQAPYTQRVFKALFCLSIEDLASVQGKADNETSASSGLSPNVATMVEDGLAREGRPKPDAVLLACCHERFEQPVANPVRNSRSRVFNFNQYIATGFPGYNVKLPPAGIASRALVTRLKNTRSIWEHISANSIPSDTLSRICTLRLFVVVEAASDAAAITSPMSQISVVGRSPRATLLRSANNSRMRP